MLAKVLDALEQSYGPPAAPLVSDPLGLILLENVAYLVDDERRRVAFSALEERTGLRPDQILSGPDSTLLEVARLGGMQPERRVEKLRYIARLALEEFDGDMNRILALPLQKAKKALELFPGIGGPGAEKVLLFTRTHAILALESNGLRVLRRLGYGADLKSYAATYRSVQDAVRDEIEIDCDWLIRAHDLLRRHGQEVCRRNGPACSACPVSDSCEYYSRH